MRAIAMLGLAAILLLAPQDAEAARWCHSGANAKGCAFRTQAECLRTVRRDGGSCQQDAEARAPPAAVIPPQPSNAGMAPGQIYPNRPAWAPPGACFTDDGGGRFRSCSAGDTM